MQNPGSFTELRLYNRSTNLNMVLRKMNSEEGGESRNNMNISMLIRPNVFYSSIVVEARCEQNTHTIVHITNTNGKIVKMFGWYLLKGSNITTIHDLEPGMLHDYKMIICDNQGNVLFESDLVPA